MIIPENVIEAARIQTPRERDQYAASRARRVILALAKEMPEEAVAEAWEAYCQTKRTRSIGGWKVPMRSAIAAFLTHVAGETP